MSALLAAAGCAVLAIAIERAFALLWNKSDEDNNDSVYVEVVTDAERKTALAVVPSEERVQLLGRLSDAGAAERCPFVGLAVLPDRIKWRSRLRALALSDRNEYLVTQLASVSVSKASPSILVIYAFVPTVSGYPCCRKVHKQLYKTRFLFRDVSEAASILKHVKRLTGQVIANRERQDKEIEGSGAARQVILVVDAGPNANDAATTCQHFVDLMGVFCPAGLYDEPSGQRLAFHVTQPTSASEELRNFKPHSIHSVVVFGGNALLHDVINGLRIRRTALSTQPSDREKVIPLLAIPMLRRDKLCIGLGVEPKAVEEATQLFMRGKLHIVAD